MDIWIDFIAVVVLLMDLMVLSSSRIRTCIKIVAVQGVLIGLMPVIIGYPVVVSGATVSSIVTIILKGIVFPWLLLRALQEANIRKEVEPVMGYPLSLLIGVLVFVLSFLLSGRLIYNEQVVSSLVAPVAFATFFTGAFIIVSRMKAITQVIGYLMLENGIYFFGSVFLGEQSLLVELAILLDIFVAIFVMGIAIFHINREFDHIDIQRLSELKDTGNKNRNEK